MDAHAARANSEFQVLVSQSSFLENVICEGAMGGCDLKGGQDC